MKTIFESYTNLELKEIIEQIISLLKEGRTLDFIKKNTPKYFFSELLSIARSKIKNMKNPKTKYPLYFLEEDLRFATPDTIANYRAQKLKTDTIIELGCGIGLQTIAFAKFCNIVIAIDIDKRKIAYAKKNAELLGIKNVIFICGNALDKKIIAQCKGDTLFLDPERLPNEKERTLATITPNIQEIIQSYQEIVSKICIELPPQIQEEIPFDEKEYVSVQGKINRLHVYLYDVNKKNNQITNKKAIITAVSLPSGEKISNENETYEKGIISNISKEYFFLAEIDEAIQKADLLEKIQTGGDLFIWKNKSYLLFKKKVTNVFLQLHKILGKAQTKEELIELLKKKDIGKIILRGSVLEQEYWPFRKSIEQNLKGDKIGEVFLFSDYIITEQAKKIEEKEIEEKKNKKKDEIQKD